MTLSKFARPRVSVIVPAYNVRAYVAECLRSMLAQTFGDFEVLVVNDGSTDDTLSVIEEYAEQDDRIVVISTANGGLSVARNHGLDRACGEFVLFLDSDDFLEPDALAVCVGCFEQHPHAGIVLFGTTAFGDGVVPEEVAAFNYTRPRDVLDTAMSGEGFLASSLQQRAFTPNVCTYMSRREAIGALRFYPGIFHEDNLFTPQLLLKAGMTVYCTSQHLFNRRVRPGSIMTGARQEARMLSYLTVARELTVFAESRVCQTKSLQRLIQENLVNAVRSCRRAFDGKFTLAQRVDFVSILAGVKPSALTPDCAIVALFPEALAVREQLRKLFRGRG